VNVPADLRYTKDHEWVRVSEDKATIGITDYAQGELGDIVFVELPDIETVVERAKPFGTIEAVKAVSDILAPISGKVIGVNSALEDDPTVVNGDPYGEGWMIEVEISDASEIEGLLTAESYRELVQAG